MTVGLSLEFAQTGGVAVKVNVVEAVWCGGDLVFTVPVIVIV